VTWVEPSEETDRDGGGGSEEVGEEGSCREQGKGARESGEGGLTEDESEKTREGVVGWRFDRKPSGSSERKSGQICHMQRNSCF
jgi:hypothetical protein